MIEVNIDQNKTASAYYWCLENYGEVGAARDEHQLRSNDFRRWYYYYGVRVDSKTSFYFKDVNEAIHFKLVWA